MVVQRILVDAKGSWRKGAYEDRALDWASQLSRLSQPRSPRDFITEALIEKRAMEAIRQGKVPNIQTVDIDGQASGAPAELLAAVMMVTGNPNEALTLLGRLPVARRVAGLEMAAQSALSQGHHELARSILLQVPSASEPGVRADLAVQYGIDAGRGLLGSGKTNEARELAITMVSRALDNRRRAPSQSRPLEQAILLLADLGEAKLCVENLASAGTGPTDAVGPAVGRRLTRTLGPAAVKNITRQAGSVDPRPWLLLGLIQEKLSPGASDLEWGR